MREVTKSQYAEHIGSDHHRYAIARENTARQGGRGWVVQNGETNKSKMMDGRHLGNTQLGVSQPLLGPLAPNLVCS